MSRPTLPRGQTNAAGVPHTSHEHEEVLRVRQYREMWTRVLDADRVSRGARIRPDVKARVRAMVDRVDQADPAAGVKDITLSNPGWRSRNRRTGRRRKGRAAADSGFEVEEVTGDRIDPGTEGFVVKAMVDGEG